MSREHYFCRGCGEIYCCDPEMYEETGGYCGKCAEADRQLGRLVRGFFESGYKIQANAMVWATLEEFCDALEQWAKEAEVA